MYQGPGTSLIPVRARRVRPVPTRGAARDSTVIVTGGLDVDTVPGLRERLLRVSRVPGSRIVLDLSGVTFCDALALGLLVAVGRRVRRHGGGLCLLAPSAAVVEALRTSGLRRLLPVVPAVEAVAVAGRDRIRQTTRPPSDSEPSTKARATSDSRRLCERA